MSESALIGIDLGKHSFHLHGQDKSGREVFRKKFSRPQMMQFFSNLPACTVVMEACAGAHFVARQLIAMGHQAKLISPQFVRPFVKATKTTSWMPRPFAKRPHAHQCASLRLKPRRSRLFPFCTACVNRWCTTAPKPPIRCTVSCWSFSKRGDKHLRQLLVQCARVYMQRLDYQRGRLADWVRSMLTRRHSNVVACALANKLARIAWALAAHHTQYEAGPDVLNA